MEQDGKAGGAAGRIAIVLHNFAPGGTERIIVRLANHWAAAGREVIIMCGSEAGPARALVGDRVTVIETVPATPRAPGSRRMFARRLAPIIAAAAPDVIVGPGNFHLPILAGLIDQGIAISIVAKLSNPLDRSDLGGFRNALFGWRKRREVRGLARLVAMSDALATEAQRTLPDARISVIGEPIVEQTDRIAHIAADAPRILIAGRLVPQKRVALALAGFAAWNRPDARLIIAGDGDQRASLERLAAKLGIAGRTTFLSQVNDMQACYASADLLLSTSSFEGFPAALVEAIVAGVPVIATRSSVALAEILAHSSLGRIVASDRRAISAALDAQSQAAPVDEPARQALARRHDASASAANWLTLLDTVVAERR